MFIVYFQTKFFGKKKNLFVALEMLRGTGFFSRVKA